MPSIPSHKIAHTNSFAILNLLLISNLESLWNKLQQIFQHLWLPFGRLSAVFPCQPGSEPSSHLKLSILYNKAISQDDFAIAISGWCRLHVTNFPYGITWSNTWRLLNSVPYEFPRQPAFSCHAKKGGTRDYNNRTQTQTYTDIDTINVKFNIETMIKVKSGQDASHPAWMPVRELVRRPERESGWYGSQINWGIMLGAFKECQVFDGILWRPKGTITKYFSILHQAKWSEVYYKKF